MIIKNIAKVCRESNSLAVHHTALHEQWVGDGSAMYNVSGLPVMQAEQFLSIFDYTSKVRNNICVYDNLAFTADKLLCDEYADEIYIDDIPEDIPLRGKIYKMFDCAGMIFLINAAYLLPLADADDEISYFMRYHDNRPVLCAKRGLIAQAVIMPAIFPRDVIAEHCARLTELAHNLNERYFFRDKDSGKPDTQQVTLDKQ